jgi:RHS repeat-associated protein
LLAIREAAGNGSSKAGQAIFPAYDGNGNIIRLFDSNGATVASYAYDGFGNRINPAASDIDGSGYANENRYGFSSKPRDPLTGLLYYGYRWYDPATGRWASRDPIGESGGLNLYGFVGNDGTNHLDKLGLSPEWHHELPNAFRAIFEKLKINIDDSNFGRIFNTGEHGWDVRHAEWNREWDEFLFDEEGNQIKRSKRDVLNKLEQMRGDSRFQKWYDHSSKPHLGYKDWKRSQRRLSYQKRVLRLNRMANRCSWSRSGHKKLSIFGLLAAASVTAGSAHAESKIHDFMITALDDLEHVVDNPNDGDAVDQAAISIGALAESIGGDFAFLAAMEQAKGGMREFVSVDCCEEDR